MRKLSIRNRWLMPLGMVGLCSSAIFDMFFLMGVFENYMGFDMVPAALLAFALAMLANLAAISWGKSKGQREPFGVSKWFWIALGVIYLLLRSIPFSVEVIGENDWSYDLVMSQISPVLMLVVSFVASGVALKKLAEKYWDADVTRYIQAEKDFTEQHESVVTTQALLLKRIKLLNEFLQNYESLENQYIHHLNKIKESEISVMSDITGKTIAAHEITPSKAHKIMNEIIAARNLKNQAAHEKAK